jgi:choline dehydrogenase-like flavoprotein
MSNVQTQNIETADVIVVGAGMAGSVMAYQLGLAGLKVLVLESGLAIPPNRSEYLSASTPRCSKRPSRRTHLSRASRPRPRSSRHGRPSRPDHRG